MIRTLHNIKRIRLFETHKNNKLRACDVRKLTGSDVVINGSLFNYQTWKPVCDVKADGKVLSNDPYAYRGLGWNPKDNGFTVCLTKDMPSFDNFISCVFLINDGKDLPLDSVTADVARSAARTAIFKTSDGLTHVWCDKTAMSLNALRNALRRFGDVVWALNLDGGGSSQLSQAGEEYVYSDRKVQNYICFWLDDEKPETPSGYGPVVKPYLRSVDGDVQLSAHFKLHEFWSRDGAEQVFVSPALVDLLEAVRAHFNAPVHITSGYRSQAHNKTSGGSPKSQHMRGLAADIQVTGHTPEEVGTYARKLMPNHGGVGIYNTPKKKFVHVDVRAKRSDWRE